MWFALKAISYCAEFYSLRLGHLRGLTVHWTVIQYPQAASLLAAARTQNGSGVINTVHYRSAATLPQRGGLRRGGVCPPEIDAEFVDNNYSVIPKSQIKNGDADFS